ncbi:hypothetical protein [Flavobacterium quisquiliarum]|uniref:Lipoprotein n=1 Tax=Flavobacterium quisquiliarum TaxID=1834436 RepID=A0ABV8WEU1_9FLAO|nr:hypothetical protein [Flavobacterium quisquiliarum]MBW1658710.1 hypothetical protein [Flavobacterium quisquiliarum]NWL03441.1 hypothetical protein [Flavobacterium collinsii]
MKKLIALFLGLTVLSCSSEDQLNQDGVSSVDTSASVLDGKVLSFKTEESFVKEYSDLAVLNSDELKNWISSKKLISLFNTSNSSEGIEEDNVPESRVVYSNALKAVLNSDSKVKIAGKTLWLNEFTFYLLSAEDQNKSSEELLQVKNDLPIYGQLAALSKSTQSLTGRNVLPNENRVKTFASAEITVSGGRLRHVIDLFNETIVLNDKIYTSKMYLRTILQYRSCSTWRCTWKEAQNLRTLNSYFCENCNSLAWGGIERISTTSAVSGTQTYLLASWRELPPPYITVYPNFFISGQFTCGVVGGGSFSADLSWY